MSEELTRDELKKQLTELGVPFDGRLSTENLQTLLDGQKHEVTEEDLKENPTLADEGVAVGDTVLLPFAGEVETENEPESEETPEDEPEGVEEAETAPEPAEEAAERTEPTKTMDYEVVSQVKHNSKRYPIGAKIRLNPEDAIPLLESGAIRDFSLPGR